MRIPLLLLFILLFVSCDLDYNDENISFEKIEILSVDAPTEAVVGTQYEILFEYGLSSSCEDFFNAEIESPSDEIKIITAYAEVENKDVCSEIYETGTESFIFEPNQIGSYIFKFWAGVDASGADEFVVHEITISEL